MSSKTVTGQRFSYRSCHSTHCPGHRSQGRQSWMTPRQSYTIGEAFLLVTVEQIHLTLVLRVTTINYNTVL